MYKGIIFIGPHNKNIKIINVDNKFLNSVYIINKYNWICDDIYNDTFKVTIKDGICICERTDVNSGWNMNLLINANIIISKKLSTIPLFFINLDKDKKRLKFVQTVLYKIFDSNNIYRIKGVEHNIGLEGCRLAHITANISAINKGFDYYIIAEDDIKPLICRSKILSYINKAILFNPDIVLLEQGQNLENTIKLQKKNENMYRIFGNGNNTGCYLCSKEFGIKLIKLWINSPNQHIDHSWQCLWGSNNVFFHRPQLFHQMSGYSNQNDVDYREETRPFNWELYYKRNIR